MFAAVPGDPSYVDALANPDAVAGGLCVIRSKSTIQLAEANSEAALVFAAVPRGPSYTYYYYYYYY